MDGDIRQAKAPEEADFNGSVSEAKTLSDKRWLRRLGVSALLTVIIYILFGVIFGVALVEGDSMELGFTGRNVVVFLRLGRPKRSDVVIFTTSSSKTLIRRVAAIGEDVVSMSKNTGNVLINGEAEDKTSIQGRTYPVSETIEYEYTVPLETVYVLGDNRETAVDSRHFGAVNERRIMGTVLFEFRFPAAKAGE